MCHFLLFCRIPYWATFSVFFMQTLGKGEGGRPLGLRPPALSMHISSPFSRSDGGRLSE